MKIKCSIYKEGTPVTTESSDYADAKLLKYKALTANLLDKLSKSIQNEIELESKLHELKSKTNAQIRESSLVGALSAYENILEKFIKNK